MKQTCRLLSEAPRRAMVLLSKDVVEKLWSLVKSYRYENRSRDLVEYTILYSVTPTNSFCFGTMYDVPWTFRNFKKWAIQLTLSKRSAVFTPSELGTRLPYRNQVTSEIGSLEINDE